MAFFLGVISNKLQEQEVHVNIMSRSQILAKRTLAALQLHFKAWAFTACGKTPFLWSNQRNACKAYIISHGPAELRGQATGVEELRRKIFASIHSKTM